MSAAPETTSVEIMQRMANEGPWFALGNGPTFEDMIVTALLRNGSILCPDCRVPLSIREVSLGTLVDMLHSFVPE